MNPPKRRGCVSVIGYLAVLFAASLVAAPQGESNVTSGVATVPSRSALPGAPLGVSAPSHASGDTAHASVPPSGAPESVLASHEGEVGTALYSASATWCAPRGDQCTNWGGDARLAAVNSFTWGDAPYWVRLWYGQEHADALVVSHCACNGEHGYIDVSPAVFVELAPLSRGRLDVAVEVLDWPVGDDPPPHPDDERMRAEVRGDELYPTLPPTDVAP